MVDDLHIELVLGGELDLRGLQSASLLGWRFGASTGQSAHELLPCRGQQEHEESLRHRLLDGAGTLQVDLEQHAATLAEGVDPWRDLLALARDGGATPKTRNSAVFWVGQAVSDRATAGLAELVGDDDADLEARETAVFALSQRRDAEAVPALLEVAQASPHAKLRRSAIFWLGQSKDPRALAWFEEVLLGESRRQP